MDSNECNTVIAAARNSAGLSLEEIVQALDVAGAQFGANARAKFARRGEF
ncbi:MAG: hypothetical protein MUC51_14310 [Anaerolineae bacterium]|nr:hypothetical protein [Anaerolineae bacterium]